MSKLEKLLSQYAAYHLDQKNVFTHFVGIPLIVFSVFALSAKASLLVSGYSMTLTLLIMLLSVMYYLSLDLIFGVMMGLIFAVAYPLALWVAEQPTWTWLGISIGIFVLGWIIQFVGHFYEKRKPAFVDDLIGLAIGPLFVLAELVFLMGLRKNLETKILIEARKLRSELDLKDLKSIAT